ncbi:MAG: hypothetical protein COZ96_04220, partial [Nitrospirae bacterium CG_4_8_14_3_um_filter_70_85]
MSSILRALRKLEEEAPASDGSAWRGALPARHAQARRRRWLYPLGGGLVVLLVVAGGARWLYPPPEGEVTTGEQDEAGGAKGAAAPAVGDTVSPRGAPAKAPPPGRSPVTSSPPPTAVPPAAAEQVPSAAGLPRVVSPEGAPGLP